jgi:hypothetical protein
MRTRKLILAGLAALSAAALAACLNNTEATPESAVLPTETNALVAFAGDSTRPAPARREACDTLTARLAGLDSAAAQYSGLETAVGRVCADHPKAPKPRPLSPSCEALMAEIALVDSGSAAFDSLWAIARAQCFPAPQPPPLKPGCAEALAARNQADSGSALYDSLARIAQQICWPRSEPVWPAICDTLAAAIALTDTLTPARDSAMARFHAHCIAQPKPVKPDTVRPAKPDSVRPQPAKPDSVRPVPPAKPDSGFTPPRDPVKPVPPNKPVKDTAASAG